MSACTSAHPTKGFWTKFRTLASWGSLLVVLSIIVHNTVRAQEKPEALITYEDWRQLADECAESLFAAGADQLGGVFLNEGDNSTSFRIPDYSKDFVRIRNTFIERDGQQFVESRFVVLTRELFPELHILFAEMKLAGKLPNDEQ